MKRTRDGEHRLPFHSGRGVKIPGSFGWVCGEEKREGEWKGGTKEKQGTEANGQVELGAIRWDLVTGR